MTTNWNWDPPFHGGNATTQKSGAQTQQTAPTPAQTQNRPNADELRRAAQEIRDAFRNNVQQELGATRDAQGVQVIPVPPTAPSEPRSITIRGPDGKETVIGVAPSFERVIPPQVVDISIAFFVTVAAIIIGLPLARAFARRMDRRTAAPRIPTDVASQLAQLNQSVDAIALEVERISEGQRFATRILSEQRDTRLPSNTG